MTHEHPPSSQNVTAGDRPQSRLIKSSHNLATYDYSLPEHLIAKFPAKRRADARLLNLAKGKMTDTHTRRLPALLRKGDVLVLNNTKVLPARLEARKQTGGKAEVLLNRFFSPTEAEAMIRAARPPRSGETLVLTNAPKVGLRILRRTDAFFVLQLPDGGDFHTICQQYGKLPLPPYIKRPPGPADYRRYQTAFAKQPGAVAAPTAGLHLSNPLLKSMREIGVQTAEITLHTGAATFAPVRAKDIRQHKMHYEWCRVSAKTARLLNLAKQQGRRIVAVGTTSLRTLETIWQKKEFSPYAGWTNLFVYPGGRPIQTADLLLTNFHLPRSSLMLLVCAFGGTETMLNAYAHAIALEYRFFSYGDAMLIERNQQRDTEAPA